MLETQQDRPAGQADEPYVPASQSFPEITLKAVVLGFVLSAVLAGANAYLGLKVGMTVSASIPAAVISMAILHFFRESNILENNIVQTAASAGESLAAGIIFTLPALIMLQYWNGFPFLPTMAVALCGGVLGVLFTIPLRRALILEANLTKRHAPRYNINLKDDKSYPYICIKNERFPRVFPTRRVKKDGSKYFGPYTDVKNMKLVLRTIRSIFKLRTCSLNLAPEPIAAGKYQTCLEYHIKKCAAPCVGYQTEESYDRTIAQVEKLVNGHTSELIDLLQDEMQRLASETRFEEAADLRVLTHLAAAELGLARYTFPSFHRGAVPLAPIPHRI